MFAEMTPGSNHTLSRKGIERNCCILYRQQKPRSEKIYHFSGLRAKDQRHTESPCVRTCLTFLCFQDQARMEQREAQVVSHVEGTEGRLRDLASKWFIDTQVPLMVRNGFFPTWFLGFISRKEAEEILREKDLGCFLVRLSDKAIGYILSYKGKDRCRHFMINQSESGQFVVCGDTEGHDSVFDLIEKYKTSPIQPFGEYLTSACFEPVDKELYDSIQVSPKKKPVASVGAVKKMQKPQINSASEQLPTRPPKSSKTVEEVPPLPRRSRHLDSSPLNDLDRVLYAQLRKQSPREIPRSQHSSQDSFPGDKPRRAGRSTFQDQSRLCPPTGPESVYSELGLLDSKSRSLPRLDTNCDGEQSYRLSAAPHKAPRLFPKPTSSRASSSHSLESMSDGAVYYLAGRPGSPHTTSSGTRYTDEAVFGCFPHDNTYELIPDHEDTATSKHNSNTYEDIRPKHNHSFWGLKNDKWKWLMRK